MGARPPCHSSRHRRHLTRTLDAAGPRRQTDERGSALALVLFASTALSLMGVGILVLSEAEALRAKAFAERSRSRAAAEAAVGLASTWFTTPDRAFALPPPHAWRLDLRRGDSDLDGREDAGCDGSTEAGQWRGYPLVPPQDDPEMDRIVARACGEPATPDLLLESPEALARIGELIGKDIVVERLAIHAGPDLNRSRSALTIEATTSVRRGQITVARMTVTGRVQALPRIRGDEVLLARGGIRLEAGATAAWGIVRAGGNIDLMPLDDDSFPRSGLPRRADGSPVGWATGGATDWDRSTPEREYVLTELIGRTRQGVPVRTDLVRPPPLADPWLGIQAGGGVTAAGVDIARDVTRQPWPYDPRVTTVEDDLSFITTGAGPRDALADGRIAALADLTAGAATGGGLRRFVLDASASRAEPLWRENGDGPARTADAWLGGTRGAPVVAAFVTGGAPAPARVTITGARGLIMIEAGEVVLDPSGPAPAITANMPGEPYVDLGADLDGDTVVDPSTIGNGRWDRDFDGDGVADTGDSDGWELAQIAVPSYWVPYRDASPTMLPRFPHEAFLNLAYPIDGKPGPVRVAFRAETEGEPAPVDDLDGDGLVRAGFDRVTTLARDRRGARVSVNAHAHALVVNMTGSVTLRAGFSLLGAVRAQGDIVLEPGARALFDEALGREGRLALPLPMTVLAGIAFSSRGGRLAAGEPVPEGEPLAPGGEGDPEGGEGGGAGKPGPGAGSPGAGGRESGGAGSGPRGPEPTEPSGPRTRRR